MNRRRVSFLFVVCALAVLALDLASKLAVYRTLDTARGPTYIHNAGSAFGLLQGGRWFFVGVSGLSAIIILLLALSGRYRDRGIQAAFGLILGGALGNLIDRLWLGVVIDFIQVGIRTHYWPVFNVADIGVTAGVGLLALRLLVEERNDRHAAADPAERPGSSAGGAAGG